MNRDERIKVAVILPSFGVGGTENMVAALVNRIDKTKFNVMVICLACPQKTHVQQAMERSGVKIYYAMKGKISSWRIFFRVYRVLSQFRPHLIHSNMYAFAFAAPYVLTHRIRMLHTIHNKPVNEFKNKYKRLISYLYRKEKAVPVAISHIIEREMKELYPQLHCIERIYNPVDTEKFRTERKKKTDRPVTFINVARFMRQKNHELLLNAFARARNIAPSVRLLLVGDGELREAMEKKAEELKLSDAVTFAGNVEDVERYLSDADVFVLSSDYEGLPLSILEAMAAGLPVISTNVGGVADIVTDNGILVKPGDVEALAEKIAELALDEEKRALMGECSLRNVQQYDSAEFIRQYESLYEKYS